MDNISNENKVNYSVPVAIVLAGIIIAGAMYFSTSKKVVNTVTVPIANISTVEQIRPISAEDHIRGNPNAPVLIVEYSDTECPLCGRFHVTMKQIMDEYGKVGKVAWVYRHSPLDQLHPKARKEAEALECAAELGGNDKFWAYADRLYEITPANNGLDVAELPNIAKYIGLDIAEFNTCLTSGKYASKIQVDLTNAQVIGSRGTPWNVLVLPNPIISEVRAEIDKYVETNNLFDKSGNPLVYISSSSQLVVVGGALPFSMTKDIIDIILLIK
jgi:protein-disulfide isomerase